MASRLPRVSSFRSIHAIRFMSVLPMPSHARYACDASLEFVPRKMTICGKYASFELSKIFRVTCQVLSSHVQGLVCPVLSL